MNDDHEPCPHCGADGEQSVILDPELSTPNPGVLRMCIPCGKLAVWNNQMQLRKPSEAEVRSLRSTPSVRKWMKAWRAIQPHASAVAADD